MRDDLIGLLVGFFCMRVPLSGMLVVLTGLQVWFFGLPILPVDERKSEEFNDLVADREIGLCIKRVDLIYFTQRRRGR